MLALFDLIPDELINRIFGFVDDRTILSLSRTSRRLHNIANPRLYANIIFKSTYDDAESTFPQLRSFTRLILSNPFLASSVYSLTLRDTWQAQPYDPPSQIELLQYLSPQPNPQKDNGLTLQPDDDPVLFAAVQKYAASDAEARAWLLDLEPKNGLDEDALMALLLSALTNLRRLDVMLAAPPYFWRLLERAGEEQSPALQALQSVTVMAPADREDTSIDYTATFFRLPVVNTIRLYGAGGGSWDKIKLLPARSSNIRHIELLASNVDHETLAHMVEACKNLTTFIYEKAPGNLIYKSYSTKEVMDALDSARSTLERLWLDYEPGNNIYWLTENNILSRVDLAGFTALKDLRIATRLLLGPMGNDRIYREQFSGPDKDDDIEHTPAFLADVLPPSIETLYFTHCNRRVRTLSRFLKQLLSVRNVSAPKLRKIYIEAELLANPKRFDLDTLVDAATLVGVEVERFDTYTYGDKYDEDGEINEGWDEGLAVRGWGFDGEVPWTRSVAKGEKLVYLYPSLDGWNRNNVK